MTEIGRELAEARKRAGMSVEELSHRTKISVPTLLAIERNQMGNLPGGLYARGLLRAYAREVGCDPEAIVSRFRAEVGENVDPIQLLDRTATSSVSRVVDRLHSSEIDAADRRRTFRNTAIFLLVMLVGGSYYFAGNRINHWAAPLAHWAVRSARPVAANVAESLTPPAAAEPKPVGTTSAQPEQPTDDHTPGLRLEIEPRDSCWLSATADGQRVIYRLLNAGERTQVDAKESVDLRIGDPAACTFTINGASARTQGAAGQAVNVHLTPQNYREFLRP